VLPAAKRQGSGLYAERLLRLDETTADKNGMTGGEAKKMPGCLRFNSLPTRPSSRAILKDEKLLAFE
jgi:hypothetical protein